MKSRRKKLRPSRNRRRNRNRGKRKTGIIKEETGIKGITGMISVPNKEAKDGKTARSAEANVRRLKTDRRIPNRTRKEDRSVRTETAGMTGEMTAEVQDVRETAKDGMKLRKPKENK